MTEEPLAVGRFQGEVLSRLKDLHETVTSLAQNISTIQTRCMQHTSRLATLEGKATFNRFLIGVLGGVILAMCSWLAATHLK